MPAPKLTPAVQENIVKALLAGNRLDVAAAYAGIHRDTLNEWMKRGRKSAQQPYRGFVEVLDQALAQCEVGLVTGINKAGVGSKDHPGDWRALSFLLERRFRNAWGAQTTVNLKRIADELASLPDDELLVIAGGVGASEDGAGDPGAEGSED